MNTNVFILEKCYLNIIIMRFYLKTILDFFNLQSNYKILVKLVKFVFYCDILKF